MIKIPSVNWTDAIILLFLIIFGFALRIYHLGEPSFWLDEAISANAAAAMIQQGTPAFPSGFVYTRAILNTLFISLSYLIFGISEFSARFPSVIFGTLTIPLVYFMGIRFADRKIALIAALFITFSVMEITWSRQARMYQQLQFFYLASLYFFYRSINAQARNKRNTDLALTVLFSIAAVLTHVFAYALFPVFTLYFVAAYYKEIRSRWKEFVQIRYLAGLFIFVLFLIFLILKFSGSNSFRLTSDLLTSQKIINIEYLQLYLNILNTELSVLVFFAVIGAALALKKNRMSGLLLIISFLIPFYVIFNYVNLAATRYLYFIFPVLLIFSSYFFSFLIELAQKYRRNRYAKTGSVLTAFLIGSVLLIAAFQPQMFMITPGENFNLGENAPAADFKKAYSYVKENMQESDVVIDSRPAVSLFYMGRSDYWLAFRAHGVEIPIDNLSINNGTNELYANALIIRNASMLKEIVAENDRGWIVVDDAAWFRVPIDLKIYISEELQLIKDLSDGMIKIYSWGIKT